MSTDHPALAAAPRRKTLVFAGAVLALCTLAAYHNSLSGPFLANDLDSIPNNPTIRHLGRLMKVLAPPAKTTVHGRPVLNLSFALNYAIGGTAPWGYHAVNLLIHVLAGLTLFGLVRRTLRCPVMSGRFGAVATPAAFFSALLWLLHPVQTQSVTYIVQRAESLMGLFYLLTLYCFLRGPESERWGRWVWPSGTVLACLLGAGTKEVAATAPLMVLLYDRTFVSGSFRESWRRHRWLYAALAATWLVFTPLLIAGGQRDVTSGFGVGVSYWAYVGTQFHAVAHYLRVAFWPHSLLLYYAPGGWANYHRTAGWAATASWALLVSPLLVGAAIALWRRPALGFAGAWFFVILAPTSLVPGTWDTMADRRLYLPLAAIIVPLVAGAFAWAGRRVWPVLAVAALALGLATEHRNLVYADPIAPWREEVATWPNDPYAHYYLGLALDQQGRIAPAMAEFQNTLRIDPGNIDGLNNLGLTLVQEGRFAEAADRYREALRRSPHFGLAENNLGDALESLGRLDEAIGHFKTAVAMQPDFTGAQGNLAYALTLAGRLAEAVPPYLELVKMQPDNVQAQVSLANVLLRLGRVPEAMAHYAAALQANPDSTDARKGLADTLLRQGRIQDAIGQYEHAVRQQPRQPELRNSLGVACSRAGRWTEAVEQFEAAVRLKPDFAEAHNNLGFALAALGRLPEAIARYREALRLKPDYPEAHDDLGIALGRSGRIAESIRELQEAIRLEPDMIDAHYNLAVSLSHAGRTAEAKAQVEAARRLQAAEH